ncbi:MAG: cyclic pyranopterin phosphate synthase MoaA [Elusimicrobia bacterium CG1_02_56_21]|nr:MAG: cyclic pyranopterin phosphate synthase MoaA [Elusimicrobia bacterium CG1_02_56_21]
MAVEYLRISLTDRCNLNCIYCTPKEKRAFLKHEELLRHEEIARAAAGFVSAGVKKIRLTGGEPLVKKNIIGLVSMLRAIPGLQELTLTTNGLLLGGMAVPLRKAGLDRVNISLDTLQPANFRKITGSEGLEDVWDGLMASLKAGFSEVKLNVVIMKGINDAEVPEFARLAIDFPLTVRFIEFFPTNERSARLKDALFTTAEAKKKIEEVYGPLEQLPPGASDGPARVYKRRGGKGKIGFISGRSDYFCGACNRVRMDCTGKVYPCLFSPSTHNLRDHLRSGEDDASLAEYIKKIFLVKSNYKKDSGSAGHIEMSSLGG